MAGGVIAAAWVQAFPLWGAAGVAAFSINRWRKELREKRHVEIAERCLIAGKEAVAAIRRARERVHLLPEDAAESPKTRRAALEKVRGDRLD